MGDGTQGEAGGKDGVNCIQETSCRWNLQIMVTDGAGSRGEQTSGLQDKVQGALPAVLKESL